MPKNWEAREKKLHKRKSAMKVNSRGLVTVILPVLGKKARKEPESGTARNTRPTR